LLATRNSDLTSLTGTSVRFITEYRVRTKVEEPTTKDDQSLGTRYSVGPFYRPLSHDHIGYEGCLLPERAGPEPGTAA